MKRKLIKTSVKTAACVAESSFCSSRAGNKVSDERAHLFFRCMGGKIFYQIFYKSYSTNNKYP